jgi:general stress protein CsbA
MALILFMQIVTKALKKYTNTNYYIVFMDNISIYSDNVADHKDIINQL